jgi:hypothetical protein
LRVVTMPLLGIASPLTGQPSLLSSLVFPQALATIHKMAVPRRAVSGMLFRAVPTGITATASLRTAYRASSLVVSSPWAIQPAKAARVPGLRQYSINKPIGTESKIYNYDDVVEVMETKKTKDGRPSYLIGMQRCEHALPMRTLC